MSEIKKVFFTCYQPYLLDVALRMYKEYNWQPIYWFTWDQAFPEVGKIIRETFPDIITQDYNDAIKGKIPEAAKHIPIIPNDAELLKEMSKYETTILSMMDRNDLMGAFTYQHRLNNYHFQLKYWNSVLEYLKPDLVFFEALPHEASDLVLYYVARKKGIKTLMYNLTHTFDRVTTMETFEKGPDLVIQRYQELLKNYNGADITLTDQNETYLTKLTGLYKDNIRQDVQIGLDSLKKIKTSPLLNKVKRASEIASNVFDVGRWKKRAAYLRELNEPSIHSYHKVKNIPFSDSVISNRTFNKKVEAHFEYKKELHGYYNSIVNKNLDFSVPYIYCPIHYQPEATTSPLGEQFVNQHLMVEMLAYNVPQGWKVYVKEHMAQFMYNLWGEPSRNKEYYDRLKAIPNVELVPLEVDSYTLIDNCKAVSTISGAVSMEAPVRGKAVLAFGHAVIYYPCEGIFYTPTNNLLKEALNQIIAGYKPDLKKIRLFVKAVEENSFKGGIGSSFNNGMFGIYREENAEGHYHALLHWIKNYKNIHPRD